MEKIVKLDDDAFYCPDCFSSVLKNGFVFEVSDDGVFIIPQ